MAFGDLCTLTDVKDWISLGGSPGTQGGIGVSDDRLLTRLITACSGSIKKHLNRPIVQQDFIEQRQGAGFLQAGPDVKYTFAVWPVSSVTYVQVNGQMIPPAPIAPLTPPSPANIQLPPPFLTSYPYQWGYVFTPTELIIRGYSVPRLGATVILQYTAGYPVGQIPEDLTQACIELVCLKYKERKHIGQASEHLGDGATVSYVNIPDEMEYHLTGWKAVAPITAHVFAIAPDQTDTATLMSIAA